MDRSSKYSYATPEKQSSGGWFSWSTSKANAKSQHVEGSVYAMSTRKEQEEIDEQQAELDHQAEEANEDYSNEQALASNFLVALNRSSAAIEKT